MQISKALLCVGAQPGEGGRGGGEQSSGIHAPNVSINWQMLGIIRLLQMELEADGAAAHTAFIPAPTRFLAQQSGNQKEAHVAPPTL